MPDASSPSRANNTRQSFLRRRLWATQVRRICRERSVILGYHGVARSPLRQDPSLLQVPPKRFRAQLELLLDAGFQFVTVAELARLAHGGSPPPGYAAISFDDGMRNNLTTALPIMAEYAIPGTVYMTVSYFGARSPWVKAPADNRMLDQRELRELAAAGWEVGAHTMTHADLSRLDYESCKAEIEQSKERLEQVVGGPVETFAYPFGLRSEVAERAARDSGLLAAVSTGQGSWEPFQIKRVMIGTLDPLAVVVMKLADRYEPLLHSPPMDLLRRASKRLRGTGAPADRAEA